MKRRQAIFGIVFTGAASYLGYKAYNLWSPESNTQLDTYETLIAEMAECVIPKTNTPGAKDVKAELMIIKLLKECTDAKTCRNFIKGCKSVQEISTSHFDTFFEKLTFENKISVLNMLEKKEKPFHPILGKIQKKVLGATFTSTLKELTVKSYCTSISGATQGLNYLPIPGKRESCIKISKDHKVWATQ